jgi:hypothetical protein
LKRVFITIAWLSFFTCLNAQGITLLYEGNGGWNDPLSWIQINTQGGQIPIQRVPTELDDIVISSSLSGLSTVRFNSDNVNPDFNIGSNISTGYRCRSMHVSNTWLSFASPFYVDASPTLNVYTANGGFVIVDSGSNLAYGQLALHGGNAAVTDLQIINSTYGTLESHADWTDIYADAGSKTRFVNSTMGGRNMSVSSGGEIYADSCTFNTTNFSLGDNSTDTVLNTSVQNVGDSYLTFFIGRNAN